MIIFGVAVFALLIFLIFRLGLFSIKKVEIENSDANCVSGNQLKITANLLGQNFFVLDQQKLNKDLKEKFVCIKSINLSRSFPGRIALKVIGRRPEAILIGLKDKVASMSPLIENIATPSAENLSEAFLVDNEGVVFSKSMGEENIPKIFSSNLQITLGKKLENNFLSNALMILDKIKTFGINAKKSWIVDDIFIINPDTSDPKIIFHLDNQTNIQLASLQLILTEAKMKSMELQVIDLRFDKPIVKFAPQKKI